MCALRGGMVLVLVGFLCPSHFASSLLFLIVAKHMDGSIWLSAMSSLLLCNLLSLLTSDSSAGSCFHVLSFW